MNSSRLTSFEERFTIEAMRRYPSDPEEQHRKAASIARKSMRTLIAERARLLDEGASEEAIRDVRARNMKDLRKQLFELTGRPKYFSYYGTVWNAVSMRRRGSRILRDSLLMSAVSEFEILVASTIKGALRVKPEILRRGGRQYTMQQIDPFESLDEFRAWCAEDKADELLRGGLQKWMKWFTEIGVSVPGVTDLPLQLVEIFQRRHLLVHAGGIVNDAYLDKVSGIENPPSKGVQLHVSADYLRETIDTLTAAGVKLCGATARKLASVDDKYVIDSDLLDVEFSLLIRGEYEVVKNVNEWHLKFPIDESWRIPVQVNYWIARKKLNDGESVRAEVESWEVEDDLSRLVKLALLDANEEAHDLATELLASEELNVDSWQNWPIFEGVRAYAAALPGEPADTDYMFAQPNDLGDASLPRAE